MMMMMVICKATVKTISIFRINQRNSVMGPVVIMSHALSHQVSVVHLTPSCLFKPETSVIEPSEIIGVPATATRTPEKSLDSQDS